jgi:hypothetical protein
MRGKEEDARRCARGTRRHFHEHVVRGRVAKVGCDLGQIRAESANGPKQSLLTSACSTIFIKGPRSLEQQVND